MRGVVGFLFGALLALALLPSPAPRAEAASGETANLSGTSVPLGYMLDGVTGVFLDDVSSASSTTANVTVAATQASGRRTFYPKGRQTLTLWLEAAASNATATVRLTYWAGLDAARVYKGTKEYALAVQSSPAIQIPGGAYSSPISFADATGASSIDVAVVALANGPVDVGVGSN